MRSTQSDHGEGGGEKFKGWEERLGGGGWDGKHSLPPSILPSLSLSPFSLPPSRLLRSDKLHDFHSARLALWKLHLSGSRARPSVQDRNQETISRRSVS